jgi:hypothetical protein
LFWQKVEGGKKKKKANGGMINKVSQQRKKISNFNKVELQKVVVELWKVNVRSLLFHNG